VRYNYDKVNNERFGALQLEWLEESIKNHLDANLTLIVSGV
jgi:hypothetical protein